MEEESTLHFDGDNSFPDCRQCGICCGLNVIAVTAEEACRMRDYVAEHNIQPIDRGKERCCLQSPEGTCMIWEARPQVCRLHHCQVSRFEILEQNPSIKVPEDLYLIDLNECFLHNGFERYADYQPVLR